MKSAGDDDLDDDAQLQQLRSVWVSMRDEEPSDRGMAALMAAARTKASELGDAAKPSWFQRALASLRRPPVLALATVTVLLGGALIITQRHSDMAATPEVAVQGDDLVAKGTTGNTAGDGSAATVEPSAVGAATTPPPIETPTERPTEPKVEPVATKPRIASPPPKIKATKPTARPQNFEEAKPSFADGRRETDAPKADPQVSSGPRGGAGQAPGLAIATDEGTASAPEASATPSTPSAKTGSKKPIARTQPPSIEGEDRVVTKDAAKPAPSTIEQLVKQCETAAAKGDCAAVRTIAQKIFTSSPQTYKSRVAANAAINRCLPSAAANTSSE